MKLNLIATGDNGSWVMILTFDTEEDLIQYCVDAIVGSFNSGDGFNVDHIETVEHVDGGTLTKPHQFEHNLIQRIVAAGKVALEAEKARVQHAHLVAQLAHVHAEHANIGVRKLFLENEIDRLTAALEEQP